MYHSVTFGNKNTYTDWHLVPDSRPVLAMPEPKTMMVEVPGANGVLDLSESLTKYPIYKNREGSFTFHVLNGYEDWHVLYNKIATYLHGKVRTLCLEDDPDFYYVGRYKVKWTSNNDGSGSEVEISYVCEPYKYYKYTSNQEAPNLYYNISNTGTNYKYFSDQATLGDIPVIPTLVVTGVINTFKLTLTNPELGLSNITKTFSQNTTAKYYDFIISNLSGTNVTTIKMEGTGRVSLDFRRASL